MSAGDFPIFGSEYVEKLPLVYQWELPSDSQGCAICKEAYAADPQAPVIKLPCCNNSFHKNCILLWLGEDGANSNTCPFCRQQLFTKWTSYDENNTEEEGEVYDDVPDGVNDEDYNMDQDEDEVEDEIDDEENYSTQLGSQRMLAASIRRDGALRDRETYEGLQRDGAQLEDNLDQNTHVLNRPQDQAIFEELKCRGAFEMTRIYTQYELGFDHWLETPPSDRAELGVFSELPSAEFS